MGRFWKISGATLLLAAGSSLAFIALPTASAKEAPPARAKYDLGKPYIGGPLPQGEILVPQAPADGSAIARRDAAQSSAYLAMQESPRFALAGSDADLSHGWFTRAFSCSAGRMISDKDTPKLVHLLRRAGTDFGMSTSGVKKIYQRPRPFMLNNAPTCTPQDEAGLRGNGSYPSGHSAIGYGTSLVLASIFPDRAAQLVTRGRAFGQSRAVCNVHWTSDIEEGRIVAAATFARLMANDGFRSDLEAARTEVAEVPAESLNKPLCAAESSALGGTS